jgi:hypothetical protein
MSIKSNFIKLKGYTQFIKEEFGELFKMILVYDDNLNYNINDLDISYKQYITKNFMLPITEKSFAYQINQTFPVINYNNDISNFLIENKLVPLNNIYNKPDDIKTASNKKDFYSCMGKSKFVPKTVFTKEEALKNLNFPIIAKSNVNLKIGKGIKIFKLKEDLTDSVDNFDIFSEKIKVFEEFSLIMFKNEPLLFMKRIPLNMKAQTGIGTIKEGMEFGYQKIQLNYMPEDFKDILKEIHDAFPNIDFFSLNLMKTEDNKLYIIKMNVQPILMFDSAVMLYHSIYKDFFKKELSEDTVQKLSVFANDLNSKTIQNSNNRFKIAI